MADINTKVAGLPVWGWGVAIVGGLGIAYVATKGSNAPIEEEDAFEDPYSYDGSDSAAIPYPGSGAIYVPGSPGQNVEQPDLGPTDNNQWERLALTELIARGYQPSVAQAALAKFLGGQDLSDQEQAMVDIALRELGPPPDGVAPATPQEPPEEPPEEPQNPNPTTNPNWDLRVSLAEWGAGIPKSVRNPNDDTISPHKVKRALLRLGLNPGNHIQATDIIRGYRRAGMTSSKIDPEHVRRLISKAASDPVREGV